MIKRFLLFLSPLFLAISLCSAAQFKPGTLPLVDGIYNSTQVVITARQPVFSWEFTGVVSSFSVTVSEDDIFSSSGQVWNFSGSTTMANTVNLITRVKYNDDGGAAALAAGRTYYWRVTIHGEGADDTAAGRFSTVTAAAGPAGGKLDLAVDWNNPFNPSKGQHTVFRFSAKDRDRKVRLRVFTLSGQLVKEWSERAILAEAWYAETWDGKDENGDSLSQGIYLVNLMDVGELQGVTRRVVVVK